MAAGKGDERLLSSRVVPCGDELTHWLAKEGDKDDAAGCWKAPTDELVTQICSWQHPTPTWHAAAQVQPWSLPIGAEMESGDKAQPLHEAARVPASGSVEIACESGEPVREHEHVWPMAKSHALSTARLMCTPGLGICRQAASVLALRTA